MRMRRGTTPTVTLTITNEDGSACDLTTQDVYVTFEELGSKLEITKESEDVDMSTSENATIIDVFLTQEETLKFHAGRKVRVQVRAKDAHGAAVATDIKSFNVGEILLEGEI